MGHNIGLSGSYYKPTEKEVLEDYLTAVNLLTISNAGKKLERQLHELKQQNKDNEYLIKSRLEETYKELQLLRQQESNSEDVIAALSDRVDELSEKLSLLNTKRLDSE